MRIEGKNRAKNVWGNKKKKNKKKIKNNVHLRLKHRDLIKTHQWINDISRSNLRRAAPEEGEPNIFDSNDN